MGIGFIKYAPASIASVQNLKTFHVSTHSKTTEPIMYSLSASLHARIIVVCMLTFSICENLNC